MKQRILKYFLVLLILVAVDILLGSLLSSSFLNSSFEFMSLHPYYNHGFERNKGGVMHFGPLHPQYFTNSLALKDRQQRVVAMTSGKRRILFLGDSFVEGVGYPFDSTFCGYLSTSLDSGKYEILNGGVRAYCPKLASLRLEYLLHNDHLRINDVYLALSSMDMFDDLVYQNFIPTPVNGPKDQMMSLRKTIMSHSLTFTILAFCAGQHYMKANNLGDDAAYLYWVKTDNKYNEETNFHFLDYRIAWNCPKLITTPVSEKIINLCKGDLAKIQKLCDDNGIKFHMVIYPIMGQTIPLQQVLTNNGLFVNLVEDYCKLHKIDMIDLDPLFLSDNAVINNQNIQNYCIEGDSHWNAKGHKRVADSLYCVINN